MIWRPSSASRTRVVAVGYASNAVGTINPIARIAEMAHSVGAWLWVDAVHYAPHGPIDVQALGCDFLVRSPYKFFGPHSGVVGASMSCWSGCAVQGAPGGQSAARQIRDRHAEPRDAGGRAGRHRLPGRAGRGVRRTLHAVVPGLFGPAAGAEAGAGRDPGLRAAAVRAFRRRAAGDPRPELLRYPRLRPLRPAHADRSVPTGRPFAAAGGGTPRPARRLRVGGQLLRARRHRAAGAGGDGRRGRAAGWRTTTRTKR